MNSARVRPVLVFARLRLAARNSLCARRTACWAFYRVPCRAMKPLDGIRVIDASRIVSGPLCAWLLASLGAEVIRVEAPGGDPTWQSPPWIGPDGVHRGARGERDLGLSPIRRGRGKRSVVLDLKTQAGRQLFGRLLAASDVLVENFVPGALARIGLDDAELTRRFPRLVHCSITGYG